MMKAFLSIIIKGLFVTYQTLRFLIQSFLWVQNVYVIYANFASSISKNTLAIVYLPAI